MKSFLLFISIFFYPISCSFENSINQPPNILFISIDDLNDWVSYLGGHPQARTPNIDRLIKKGVGFSKAYTVAPLCNPSRVAVLTGLYPTTSGVYGNRNNFRENLPNQITLMQYFKENGYITKGGGKIFHQNNKPGDNKSWDDYFVSKNITKEVGKDKSLPMVGAQKGWFNWGPLTAGDEEMQDVMTANWAISELKKNHDQPLFLACGFFRPHLPWYVPQKYFDRYPLEEIILPKVITNDRDDLPEFGKKFARERYSGSLGTDLNKGIQDHDLVLQYDQWQKGVQAYLASISFIDDYVGKVLYALENSDHARNTIVVLWGDHGWHLGEKQHWRKQALWEDTTHVPFIVSYPDKISQNKICNSPVSLIDIFPTLIELSGLPEKADLDGKSLVPLLKNPTMDWDRPVLTTYGKGNHSIRSGKWRYIQYRDGGSELYDHQKDPHEWFNLSDEKEYQKVVAEIKAHLPTQEK